jgi:hypothetical protein
MGNAGAEIRLPSPRIFFRIASSSAQSSSYGWEFDPVSGTGSMKLGKDARLKGRIKIKNGDESTFVAERATEPERAIQEPPSYRDKWTGRW